MRLSDIPSFLSSTEQRVGILMRVVYKIYVARITWIKTQPNTPCRTWSDANTGMEPDTEWVKYKN